MALVLDLVESGGVRIGETTIWINRVKGKYVRVAVKAPRGMQIDRVDANGNIQRRPMDVELDP